MVQKRIEDLRTSLQSALQLDLDNFGLEVRGDELISKFIGLSLHSAFQPIFSNEQGANKVIGYEGLLRPAIGPEPVSPLFAFDFADKQGHLVKLDRIARTLHMLNYLGLPKNRGLLFLNVHPKLLVSVNVHGLVFERILHAHSVPTNKVVIEVLEHKVEVEKQLSEAIVNYQDRGYLIAIDDFGSRHSNLDRLWRISPDYIKLDISLIREAESNPRLRSTLPKLIEIVKELGAHSIIEGIENATQYQIALDSGASLLQGFYLGEPRSLKQGVHPITEATA